MDDLLLDENAQLMPVERPPEIPIEPKGEIPTQPVNPELPVMTPPPPPPPADDVDTDDTEVLESTKDKTKLDKQPITDQQKQTSMNQNKTKDAQNKPKKKPKKKRNSKPKKTTLTDDVKKYVKKEATIDKKGRLVTETFVLHRRGKPKRKFYCMVGKCKKTCATRRELNNHNLTSHLKIVCDICNNIFDTPRDSFLKAN